MRSYHGLLFGFVLGVLAVQAWADEEVELQGEYATIDTSKTLQQIKILAGEDAAAKEELIEQIKKTPGDYMPPVFMGLAQYLYDAGQLEDAYFWFCFGRMRGRYDAARCADESAGAGIDVMVSWVTPELRGYLTTINPDDIVPFMERVIALDEATPYHYDHRWINLHGLGAVLNKTPLSVPELEWPALLKEVRSDYLAGAVGLARQLRQQAKEDELFAD